MILFFFVLLCVLYLWLMMRALVDKNPVGVICSGVAALINLVLLVCGILGEPGVRPSIYKRWSDHYLGYIKPQEDIEAT